MNIQHMYFLSRLAAWVASQGYEALCVPSEEVVRIRLVSWEGGEAHYVYEYVSTMAEARDVLGY